MSQTAPPIIREHYPIEEKPLNIISSHFCEVIYRFTCDKCGAIHESQPFKINREGEVPTPSLPEGWSAPKDWMSTFCDKHEVTITLKVDGE